jgi:hypothetical protein
MTMPPQPRSGIPLFLSSTTGNTGKSRLNFRAARRRSGRRCRNTDGVFQFCGVTLAPGCNSAERQFCRHVRGRRQPVLVGPQQLSFGTYDHGVCCGHRDFPAIWTALPVGSDSGLWWRGGDWIFATDSVGTLHFRRFRRCRLRVFDKPVCSAAQLTLLRGHERRIRDDCTATFVHPPRLVFTTAFVDPGLGPRRFARLLRDSHVLTSPARYRGRIQEDAQMARRSEPCQEW